MNKLLDFVAEHRARFVTVQDNTFAFSWGKVFRRFGFLEIIQQRHEAVADAFVAHSEVQRKAFLADSSSGFVSQELLAIIEEGQRISADLHLQIESYYLFAKILLDDVARAIEYYFGAQRGLALDSHDDLTERIRRYAAAKELVLSGDLVDAAGDLKRRICDFRDSQIAHEKSPRTTQGTVWTDKSDVRVAATRLYPKETDPTQVQTETPGQLRVPLEIYFDLVVAFLSINESKTNLTLAS